MRISDWSSDVCSSDLVRLTGGHKSKRLNCVVPLDPSDCRDMDLRLEKAGKRFQTYGRPLIVRETPLAPAPLIARLAERGWTRFEPVKVMTTDLASLELDRKSTRLNSSHSCAPRMPTSA